MRVCKASTFYAAVPTKIPETQAKSLEKKEDREAIAKVTAEVAEFKRRVAANKRAVSSQ